MRNTFLMAVACLGAAIGTAQTMQTTVKVNFAHDTQVGKVSLPAGKYSIKELANSVIEISSDDRKGANVFATVMPVGNKNGEASDRTKIVLQQEENGSYELKSIWLEGQNVGFELE